MLASCWAAEIWLGSTAYNNASRLKDILLLNLDRRPERLANVSSVLRNAGLAFTRFPAVDGHLIKHKQFNKIAVNNQTLFSFSRWGSQPHPVGDYGVVGCWQSHMQAYFHIAERVDLGEPDLPVMILEDDVYLKPNATDLINRGGADLPADWEIYFVGYKNDYCYHYVSPFLCRGSMLLDAHAYIVRNASVARKLIFYANKVSPQTADIYWIPLFKDILHIYLIRPYEVIRQNKNFGTDIQISEQQPVSTPAATPSSPFPTSPPPPPPPLLPSLPSPPHPLTPSVPAAKLPNTGALTLEHLMGLRALLGSAEVEAAMGYAKIRPEENKPAYDYTNIMRFFLEQFEFNKLQAYVGDHPVLCFDMDLHYSQLGNRLGNFFEAMSFAQLQGLHFVAFSIHSHQELAKARSDSYVPLGHAYVRTLPTVVLHPNPVRNRSHVAVMLGTEAGQRHKEPWPWQERNSSWLYNVDFIGKAMRSAVNAFMAEAHKSPVAVVPASTFHHPKEHHHNHRHNHTSGDIKLIPDVAILLRCSDIVLHGGNEYGFLNFNTYPKLIKTNTPKEIYILSEPLKYGPWTDTCLNITRTLVAFLSPLFPTTTILVRRGYVFDALATFALAPTVICAPSTFCFWPALANPSEEIHYAASPLINRGLAPRLKDGFHWIIEPQLMGFWKQSEYDLRWDNATEYIVDKLKSTKPPNAKDGGYVYKRRA